MRIVCFVESAMLIIKEGEKWSFQPSLLPTKPSEEDPVVNIED